MQIVELDNDRLAAMLKALSHPVRLEMVRMLADCDQQCLDLTREVELAQSTVSEHLRVLKEAGLVAVRREGRFRYYRLRAAPLAEVLAWVRSYERFWDRRLTELGRVLDGMEGREG